VKILQNVVLQGKKLGKAVYVFSVDSDAGKVAHCNFIPDATRARGIDARVWAAKVAEVLGGRVMLLLFPDHYQALISVDCRLEGKKIVPKVLGSTWTS
jgi:hypothetical protein